MISEEVLLGLGGRGPMLNYHTAVVIEVIHKS